MGKGDFMNDKPLRTFGGSPAKVVIAGGGVAGLEAMLGLWSLARERVSIDLIAPEREYVYRPLSVLEPFKSKTPRFDLARIARDHGAKHCTDSVEIVDADRHRLRTRAGKEIAYDALIVASGAKAREVIPGALTFGADVSGESFAVLVDEVERGSVHSIAFALPGGIAWSLPLYELALNMADHFRTHEVSDLELTIVTPEDAPLAVFGQEASEAIHERLEEAGVRLLAATHPVAVKSGEMAIIPHGYLQADRVIALPRLEGLPTTGLPSDDAGFIPTDEYGQVEDVSDVYAAGDCTSFPIKQGGMAAAQADVVAQVIAARAGAPVTPSSFRPVLYGMLLGGDRDLYLSARITRGPAMNSAATSAEPLWWPPPKIHARYLAPYLAQHGARVQQSDHRADLALQ